MLKRFFICLWLVVILMPGSVFAQMTWKEIRREVKPWGIDVTVQFVDKTVGIDQITQMRFDNTTQITKDFDTRMAHIADNIISDIAEQSKHPEDIFTRTDIEAVLKAKELIKGEEKWEDLKSLSEITATTAEGVIK